MKKKLILIGAGGHAKSVFECVDKDEFDLIGFIDSGKTGSHMGKPIIADSIDRVVDPEQYVYFVTIGDNECRKKWYLQLLERNLSVVSIISKTAIISDSAILGNGVFIGHYCIVNSDSVIGENCIINTKALVEHECVVGSHCHLSTNSVINGGVHIEEGVFLGSSSVVNGQIVVGRNSIIGSGSVVIRNIPECVTAVGNPTRIVKKNNGV